MMTGFEVVMIIGLIALNLALAGCFVLAVVESRKVCRCERCREEQAMRGASELDRVWARVGLRVRNRILANAPTGRGPTQDDGRGAA